eukprot:TRINITY_DN1993_c1_g1_i1.p1 TRINITY_DN1993_c1_g1~~TRINITY_DN1993_c1_g1_i1.p1  ORF type:complete len:298 (-),score=84.85 TRINITY_DN1993_c1_g1_i1:43-936(-)
MAPHGRHRGREVSILLITIITYFMEEKQFIQEGVAQNVRLDGRKRLDFRPVFVETGVVPQAHGSARVKVAHTDVIVSVKADLGSVEEEKPEEGRVEVTVESSPNVPNVSIEWSQIILRMLQSQGALNRKALCLVSYKYCWVLQVDAVVLQSDGNIMDAISFAVKAALFDTKIPKVTAAKNESGDYEFEVSEDPEDVDRLQSDAVPICVSLCVIGNEVVVDPCLEEEECISAKLIIGINRHGEVSMIQKSGSGSIEVDKWDAYVEIGRRIGFQVIQNMQAKLLQDESERKEISDEGMM